MKAIALSLALALAAHAVGVSAAQPALDPLFGIDGVASHRVVPPHAGTDGAAAVVLLRDGFAHIHVGSTPQGLVISRQLARGAADATWGRSRNGVVTLDDARWQLTPTAAAMQTHRRLLVAGYATSRADGRVVPLLCRFLQYGTPDPAMVSTDDAPAGCRLGLPSGAAAGAERGELALALAVQTDGKILVASRSGTGPETTLHVNRLQPDGVADQSFGPAADPLLNLAYVTLAPSGAQRFGSALPIAGIVQDGRRIMVAGSVGTDASPERRELFVAAFMDRGMEDETFGDAGGMARVALEAADAHAIAFERADDGRLFLAGTVASPAAGLQAVVVRLLPNGERDATFAEGGIARLAQVGDAPWTGVSDLLVDPAGRAVLAGSVHSPDQGDQIGLLRLRPDGSPDVTFGGAGVVRFDFAPAMVDAADWVSSLALSWAGSVVVGGQADDDEALFRAVRLRMD